MFYPIFVQILAKHVWFLTIINIHWSKYARSALKIFHMWGTIGLMGGGPTRTHHFNAKIGFEKYSPGPYIWIRMCQNQGRQTKTAYLEIFLQNLKTNFCVETVSSRHLFLIAWSLYSEEIFFDLFRCRQFFYFLRELYEKLQFC